MHVVIMGAMTGDALDELGSAGHEVTLVHEPVESHYARKAGDRVRRTVVVDSYADVDAVLALLAPDDGTQPPVDAVVALEELAVLPAAYLGARLGARCLPVKAALRCRDKAVQKTAWAGAGVPTADWSLVADAQADPEAIARDVVSTGLTGPFVVKPVAYKGGKGVRPAADEKELAAAVADVTRTRPGVRRLLVERRNAGDEWHVDGVVRSGSPVALLVSRYLTPLIETRNGHPAASVAYHPARDADVYRQVAPFVERSLKALGLADGVFHFEAFGAPGSLVAGELAARPAGGWIPRVVQRMLGVSLPTEAVRAVLGEPPAAVREADAVYGWVHLPTLAGRPNRVGTADLAGVPGMVDVAMTLPYGETMPDMAESTGVRLGTVMVRAERHAEGVAALRRVIDAVQAVNGRR